MNHIQLYEQLMDDTTLTWEERSLVKQFYSMPLQQANAIVEKIAELIDAKVTDFMMM